MQCKLVPAACVQICMCECADVVVHVSLQSRLSSSANNYCVEKRRVRKTYGGGGGGCGEGGG